MGTVRVVNMIPLSLSGETNQDSEPNLAVNPEHPTDMVATAFTPAPMGGAFAPIYVSTDGGNTWNLRSVVPGNGPHGTGDITVGFATSGGVLYAGIVNSQTNRMQILRTQSFASATPMTALVERIFVDQPWVVAGSVVINGLSRDRVYVGNDNLTQPDGRTATVDVSQNASTALPPAGFVPISIERRPTAFRDGPPIRIALHTNGTVYAAFQRRVSGTPAIMPIDYYFDIVVTRDNNGGAGTPPFSALVDAADGVAGQRVVTNRFIRFNAIMGQERLGGDLAIAVDPTDSRVVWIAWCDRVGGPTGTDNTLHVRRSTDSGQTWSPDVRTITNAKNPSLAVNTPRVLGLVYQLFTGTQWVTKLELTSNAWASPPETHVLHQAPSTVPVRDFLPYIGDYIRLLAVGREFYGVFAGNNTPDMANFPSGVRYQRRADWGTRRLLSLDGTTTVQPSIDPFFFRWTETVTPPGPILTRETIISRGPSMPSEPIIPQRPTAPEAPAPAVAPEPPSGSPGSERARGRRAARSPRSPNPPTDIEL